MGFDRDNDDPRTMEAFNKFLIRVENDAWGEELISIVLSRHDNVTIMKYYRQPSGNIREIDRYTNPNSHKTICILYNDTNHYDALLPIEHHCDRDLESDTQEREERE
jgi:hypothetical protein